MVTAIFTSFALSLIFWGMMTVSIITYVASDAPTYKHLKYATNRIVGSIDIVGGLIILAIIWG